MDTEIFELKNERGILGLENHCFVAPDVIMDL